VNYLADEVFVIWVEDEFVVIEVFACGRMVGFFIHSTQRTRTRPMAPPTMPTEIIDQKYGNVVSMSWQNLGASARGKILPTPDA
jgi:hypothetical protein